MAEKGDTTTQEFNIREAVGVFHSWDDLRSAVDDLLVRGFDRSEISLLADEKTVEKKLGKVYEHVRTLEDDPEVPRTGFFAGDSLIEARTGIIGTMAYVGALAAIGVVVASGGTIAAAIAAATVAGGSGGVLGSFAARAFGRERAKDLQAKLAKGGLLLWVHVRDASHEERAVEALKSNNAEDVHVHEFAANASPDGDPLSGLEPDPFLSKSRI